MGTCGAPDLRIRPSASMTVPRERVCQGLVALQRFPARLDPCVLRRKPLEIHRGSPPRVGRRLARKGSHLGARPHGAQAHRRSKARRCALDLGLAIGASIHTRPRNRYGPTATSRQRNSASEVMVTIRRDAGLQRLPDAKQAGARRVRMEIERPSARARHRDR